MDGLAMEDRTGWSRPSGDGSAREPAAGEGSTEDRPGRATTDAAVEGRITVVVLQVNGHHYCVDVAQVQEIVTDVRVTEVPGAPDGIRGVTNVRGRVLAVADLSRALKGGDRAGDDGGADGATPAPGLPTRKPSDAALILVLDPRAGEDMSVMVDDVLDVTELSDHALQPPPPFGLGGAAPYATAVTELDEGELAVVLDLKALFRESSEVGVPTEAGTEGTRESRVEEDAAERAGEGAT